LFFEKDQKISHELLKDFGWERKIGRETIIEIYGAFAFNQQIEVKADAQPAGQHSG
jgi:hypothetical protein